MAIDQSRMENLAGLDTVENSARMNATLGTVTVRSVTFPVLPYGNAFIFGRGAPVSITSGSAIALDAGQIMSGICTLKPTASVNLTFDTAAQIVAGVNAVTSGAQVGDQIWCTVSNGASGAFTLAPQAGSGVTFDANQANTTITNGTSREFIFRLTNVTPGSEAVTLYW